MLRPGDYVVVERPLRRGSSSPAPVIDIGRVGKVASVNGALVRVAFWRDGEVWTHAANLRYLEHGVRGRKAWRRTSERKPR